MIRPTSRQYLSPHHYIYEFTLNSWSVYSNK